MICFVYCFCCFIYCLNDLQWPFAIEKPSALDELRLYWRFNNVGTPSVVKDLSAAFRSGLNEEVSTILVSNDGVLTRTGAPSVPTTTTHTSAVDFEEAPCVEDEEWYFVAPKQYLGNIKAMYDGSMEFMLRIAQSSGVDRDYHGFITLRAADGAMLSYKMPNFKTIAKHEWSAYVVILREDFGWTNGTTGLPVSTGDMMRVLENVSELLIRGDTNVCGDAGDGMEVVYIQNITMRLPKGSSAIHQ